MLWAETGRLLNSNPHHMDDQQWADAQNNMLDSIEQQQTPPDPEYIFNYRQ